MAKKKVDSVLDLSGAWYNPEKSGWGCCIINHSEETQSIQIYTYDNKGNQIWLVGVSPRGTGNFTLLRPTASGPFDNISGYDTGESAGRIDIDLVEPGKISYTALIANHVINPGPQFSPPPPAWHTFTGQLQKI
jgi:hypothetical protein